MLATHWFVHPGMEQPNVQVHACTYHLLTNDSLTHGSLLPWRQPATGWQGQPAARGVLECGSRTGAASDVFVKRPISQGHSGAHDVSRQYKVVPGLAGGRQLCVRCQFGGSTRYVSETCSSCAQQHLAEDRRITYASCTQFMELLLAGNLQGVAWMRYKA